MGFPSPRKQEMKGFDKLSPNGFWGTLGGDRESQQAVLHGH
jgi:hypothetical protein